MQSTRSLCPFVAILAVMSMLLSTQVSHAATFYVATYGNDANAGTEESPFQTIQRGAWALSTGDTLIVREGTYLESLYYVPSGTSWSEPVTVQAAPGETVVLQATAPIDAVVGFDGQYIILDGFILDANNIAGWAFSLGDASYIRVMNCEMKNARYSGMGVGGHGHEFSNLDVHDNGSSLYDHGIYITSSNTRVEHSRFYRNVGYGVHNYSTVIEVNNNTFNANTTYNNGSGGFWVGMGNGHTVSNNIIWGNEYGLILYTQNSKVYGNTIYNNSEVGIAILFSNDHGVEITANTVYGNAGGAIEGVTYATVRDNFFDTVP
jgi:hypothetical protein